MKKLICIAVCAAYLFTSTAAVAFEAQCINPDGKFVDCKAEIDGGKLTVSYDGKKWQKLNKTIDGSQITALSGGEYARRRVGESVGSAVLLGPLFLFMLFSKKKRDNFGIEYATESGAKDAVMVQLKKKYGFAFGHQLKTISGKEIQMEGAAELQKSIDTTDDHQITATSGEAVPADTPTVAPSDGSETVAAALPETFERITNTTEGQDQGARPLPHAPRRGVTTKHNDSK